MPALDHYSFTSLVAWEQCPAGAAERYLEGHAGLTSEEQRRGALVHEAAEKIARHCVRNGLDSDPRYASLLADACPDPEAAKVIRACGDLLVFDPATVLADERGVEREWQATTAAGDRVVGRVDRVEWNEAEDELIITDYKSGCCWPKPTDPCPIQLRLYAWGLKQEWPQADVLTLRFLYLGSRTMGQWQFLSDDPEVGEAWVQEWIDRVKALQPPYAECPGSWCAYCPRLEACAAPRAETSFLIANEEQATAVAGHALVLEEAAARARKAIDKWRRETGREIRVGDMVRRDSLPAWFRKRRPRFVPKEGAGPRLRDLLEANGHSILDFVDWRPDKLGALVERVDVGEDVPGAVFMSPKELEEREALSRLLEPVIPQPRAAWEKAAPSTEGETECAEWLDEDRDVD